MAEHTLPTGNGPRIWQCIEQKLLQIDPGHGGTHSVDRKSTQDMAEHTLPIKNRPRLWWNTYCQPEFHLGHGGTPSADWKLT